MECTKRVHKSTDSITLCLWSNLVKTIIRAFYLLLLWLVSDLFTKCVCLLLDPYGLCHVDNPEVPKITNV